MLSTIIFIGHQEFLYSCFVTISPLLGNQSRIYLDHSIIGILQSIHPIYALVTALAIDIGHVICSPS